MSFEWQQRIIDSDKKSEQDSTEKIAIDFIESQKTANISPERLKKLVNAITKILEEKQHDEKVIQEECEKALDELKSETEFWSIIWFWLSQDIKKKSSYIKSKATNLATGATAEIDVLTSTNDKIVKYDKDTGNEAVLIKDFEKELGTKDIDKVNSLGFAHYLLYLQEQNSLTSMKLGAVLGGYPVGKQKLQDLAILWGLDDPDGGTLNTNVQKKLKDTNPVVLETMRKLLSKELREYLDGPKNENGYVKTILKTRYGDKFNEEKFNQITGGDIIDIKTLAGFLRELTGKDMKNLKDLNDILAAHEKDVKIEEIRNRIEESEYVSEVKSGKPRDVVKEKEITDKKERIKHLQQESSALKNKKTQEWMFHYISGKIERKEFDKIVAEWIEIEKKKNEENKNASNKKKDENKTGKTLVEWEKPNTEQHQRRSTVSQRIENIDDGKSLVISLDRSSKNSNKLIIERQGDSYTIRSRDSSIGAVVLTKEKIPAYVESLRFMEKIGLGYFVQNLSQSELSKVLERSSKDTIRVNNQDGNFDESEKKRILSAFGKILGIDGIDNIINSQAGEEKFKSFFLGSHDSIESILMDKWILRNGALQVPELEKQISA